MLMCRELAGIASDYIDGELSTGQNLSVKFHLMMCSDCRTFIGNLRMSTELMQAHTANIPNEEFIQEIDRRVADALSQKARPGDSD
ncbi:MAG: zf-HC2 domain-containing protein [Marinobacter sp.]|nr:zf-HC2 domain-containing protein [Marinobacter sp.]